MMVRFARVAALLGVVAVVAAGCGGKPHGLWTPRPADYLTMFPICDPEASSPPAQPGTGHVPFWLSGPHFNLEFAGATVSRTDKDFGQAGAGQEFVCLDLLANYLPVGSYPTQPGDSVTARLVVDGKSRPLPSLPTGGLQISVPIGHAVTLQVTDAGRTQSMDVRTGARGGDEIPIYYRPRAVKAKTSAYDSTGRVSHQGVRLDVNASLSLDKLGGSLEPWVPSRGWAPAGKCWLVLSDLNLQTVVSLVDKDLTPLSSGEIFTSYAVEAYRSFTLTPTGSRTGIRPARTPTPPLDRYALGGVDLSPEFTVPDTFAGGDLLFQPTGTFYPGGHSTAADPRIPYKWTKTLPPRHVAVTLG